MTFALRRRWKTLRHRARRLGQVGLRQRLLLIEATLRLAAARIALRLLPFPRIARSLGGFMPPPLALAKAARTPLDPHGEALAREIGWAVTRAARHLPFEAVCLPQAMAAHQMLKRRGVFSVIHFGTARGEGLGLDAHAWLDAGAVEVTGYPIRADFTEIACIA